MNPSKESDRWFVVPGHEGGRRTLREQMLGVASLLPEANGKRVLDLGCAEGLIAFEFARAGAVVYGCDFNSQLVETANRIKPQGLPVELEVKRVQDLMQEARAFDIVLALAILHKLDEPAACLRWIAGTGASLVAVRLPVGSKGAFASKHHGAYCDVPAAMKKLGFRLAHQEPGPRQELVQHYRR